MNEFVARNGLIALDSSSISGPLTVSDNIGIGTTSPTARLDVRGNISSSGNFTIGGNIYKSVDTNNLGLYGGPTNSVLNGFIKINGVSNLWGQVQINIGYEPDNSKGIWTLNDSTQLMTLTGRGRLGIGVTSPAATLDVVGNFKVTPAPGSLLQIGSNTNTSSFQEGGAILVDERTVTIGSWDNSKFNVGTKYNHVNNSEALDSIEFIVGATTTTNGRAMFISSSGNIGIGTTSPTYRLDINGSFRSSGSITATSGSDYFDISHDITQPAQTGSQVYEVNITPTFRYAAPNQTQTALRVAATFSGSTALSSSQSNIIADFGSTSAGSQLVINDVTSGSIYMVNDVSGLPIIEANSNWDVFIYDYPSVIFRKTGSRIDINGTLRVSGSFILPLSQSTSPQVGSAYWSGSFLFVYDGTQYRSASFS